MSATPTTTKPNGTLPKGTFDAQITTVSTLQRKDGAWALLIVARAVRLNRDAKVWQGLAVDGDNPYDLDAGREQTLRRFAERLGIRSAQNAEEIVEDLMTMAESGEVVQLKVWHGPAGQQTQLFREGLVPAVEPTEAAATDAHQAHEKIVRGQREIRQGLAHMAEGAHALRGSEGWRALGCETLSEYLASPEIEVSRTQFYRLAEIWQRYVIDGHVDAGLLQGAHETKLAVPLPALEAGVVTAEQAIADAEVMTRKDLEAHYRELLGDEDPGDGDPAPPSEEPSDPVLRNVAQAIAAALKKAGGNAPVEHLARVAIEAATLPLDPNQALVVPEAARTVTATLRRVLEEVGRPERRQMSRELREQVIAALALADEQGMTP